MQSVITFIHSCIGTNTLCLIMTGCEDAHIEKVYTIFILLNALISLHLPFSAVSDIDLCLHLHLSRSLSGLLGRHR